MEAWNEIYFEYWLIKPIEVSQYGRINDSKKLKP